ncbi:MAG: helix-hairpin-helix domain-containing protein [Pseudomonadota bacterium]
MKNYLLYFLLAISLLVGNVLYAEPLNINTATAEQIADNLKGVGLKKAQAIIQYREQYGKFNSAQDLLNVKGIGESTLQNNQSNLLFE